MLPSSNPLRFAARAMLGLAALLVFSLAPAGSAVSTAKAQTVSVEFRTALDPYGSWRRHDRWGDVWVPARLNRGWRPYTVGHWVYSDDYGWYWVAHEREARWGWVVYHYGRWVRDRELGWVWVPGREWAPAWVSWRRGGDHIGWAPLPPERLIVEYRDDPDVWIFVQGRRFTAPLIADVVVAFDQQPTYFGQTVLVNRTVVVTSGGPAFAVNPGIAPTIISAVIGQPLTMYQVRPVVFAGTANIPNAVTVQASELQQGATQVAAKEVVQETQAKVEPAQQVPEPEPLAANENGRLGENPPKAAQQAAQKPSGEEATGKTAAEQQQQGEQADDKAAAQQKAGDSQDKAATQQQADEAKDKSAASQKADDKAAAQKDEEAKDKAAAQQKSDEAEGKAAAQQKTDEAKDKAAAQQKSDKAGDKAAAQQKSDKAKDQAAGQRKQAEEAKAAAQRKAEQAKDKAAAQQKANESKAKPAAEKAKADTPKQGSESARGAAERAAPKQAPQPRPRQAEQAAPKAPAKQPETAGQSPAPKAAAPAPAQDQPKQKPER